MKPVDVKQKTGGKGGRARRGQGGVEERDKASTTKALDARLRIVEKLLGPGRKGSKPCTILT